MKPLIMQFPLVSSTLVPNIPFSTLL